MKSGVFNIRVYGLLFDAQKRLLISEERIRGRDVVKFPGGGLEFGEGMLECIIREFKEETGQDIKVSRHFYTTDFFQASAFNPTHQIISVYYVVCCDTLSQIPVHAIQHSEVDTSATLKNFVPEAETQALRWVPFEQIRAKLFTFPIDQHVAGLIIHAGQGSF